MKKIAIIAAMEEEMQAIKEMMNNIKLEKVYETEIIEGVIDQKQIVLAKCGVGKVNSARITQMLIDKYEIEFVVNVGSAGALNEQLNIGDIVIGKTLVQHDFDITAFGHAKGYITDIGREIVTDANLIQKCEKAIESILNKDTDNKCVIGTIASGDQFCTELELKKEITNEFHADCVEMEGAAIAQVCMLDKVSCVVIRSISDKVNGNNQVDFETYLKKASKNCAKFIEGLLKQSV